MKFKQKGREEQCEPDAPAQAKKVATLLGTDHELMMKAFCKPKIKVNKDNVKVSKSIKNHPRWVPSG